MDALYEAQSMTKDQAWVWASSSAPSSALGFRRAVGEPAHRMATAVGFWGSGFGF